MASVLSWIKTNTDYNTSDGGDPSAADGTATRSDGTQRAFDESKLKVVLNEAWVSGGDPDTIMLGSGMTIINPPYTLADEMRTVLPWLCETLAKGSGTGWSVDQLIAE